MESLQRDFPLSRSCAITLTPFHSFRFSFKVFCIHPYQVSRRLRWRLFPCVPGYHTIFGHYSSPTNVTCPKNLKCASSITPLRRITPNFILILSFLIPPLISFPLFPSSISFQWLAIDYYVWRTKAMIRTHVLLFLYVILNVLILYLQ